MNCRRLRLLLLLPLTRLIVANASSMSPEIANRCGARYHRSQSFPFVSAVCSLPPTSPVTQARETHTSFHYRSILMSKRLVAAHRTQATSNTISLTAASVCKYDSTEVHLSAYVVFWLCASTHAALHIHFSPSVSSG